MEKIKILLSVAELDKSFEKMVASLKEYATVDVVDLVNYSLADYDIFIGKKLLKSKLSEANKLKYIFAYKTDSDSSFLLQERYSPDVSSFLTLQEYPNPE